ncbi:MAG: recombination mediator RecR [Tannerellaceae bacterium]|jgi:recombination protein RecR|nr:recombination mediator RecR [Tannerellaceae bacterium]
MLEYTHRKYPSVLLERAVEELSKLPGVGRRTALRLALHLLRCDKAATERLASALVSLRLEVKYCRSCHNICDADLCEICSDRNRDGALLCVVENVREMMAVESTGQFRGLYHVLGGVISPLDGIGPGDIEVDSLVERVAAGGVTEVILALSATMEGDTTCFFIYRKLAPTGVGVSVIARGVAVGDELSYADELTLGRSIMQRIPFEIKEAL